MVLPQFANAQHTQWERHLHRVEREAERRERSVSDQLRKKVIDEYVQKHPSTASDIVHCEVCEERIRISCEANLDLWAPPQEYFDIRAALSVRNPFYKAKVAG